VPTAASLSANEGRSRGGSDANATQVAREFLAPLAQGRLAEIQALTLFADRVDDHMDVRMRLVGRSATT
jgi:hypothetical protein